MDPPKELELFIFWPFIQSGFYREQLLEKVWDMIFPEIHVRWTSILKTEEKIVDYDGHWGFRLSGSGV